MQGLCPHIPLAPHWHTCPRSGGSLPESLGNSQPISPDLAPNHPLTVSKSPWPWTPQGGRVSRGWVRGEVGTRPFGVCTARVTGALSLRPRSCHLPRCLAAVPVPGLGLATPPRASSLDQDLGVDMSRKAWAQPGCHAGEI